LQPEHLSPTSAPGLHESPLTVGPLAARAATATPSAPRRRWPQRLLLLGGVVLALAIAVRLILDPLGAHFTRQGLARMKGFRGDFSSVHVTLFGPGYTIRHLKIAEVPGTGQNPVLYADTVHVGIDWRQLLRGEIVTEARFVEPKIEIINRPTTPVARTKAPPDLSQQLGRVTKLKVARVEIIRGELLLRDLTLPRKPELWVHRLEVAAENLATRETMAHARPTTLTASGILGDSGDFTVFATADAFARPLAFAGTFELRGLRVAELYGFIEPETKLQTPNGTLDLSAEFMSKGGRLQGGVKPVLKNVQVRAAEGGAWDKLKAWLTDKAVKLGSDRVPGRNAVATVVPLEGRLTDPDVQLWPAVLGVVRNAFVEGLASGFAHLPPEQAAQSQSLLAQAKRALDKNAGPPKAQPPAQKKVGQTRARGSSWPRVPSPPPKGHQSQVSP
jgi:hypothetical protein